MEIYTLEITFPYDESEERWLRVLEVKENITLKNLHTYIQDVVNFDNDHMYTFYVGKKPQNEFDSLPEKVKLNEIYPITGYKLYYLFDFGDSWLFQIKKSRKRASADSNLDYPRIVKAVGDNPEQYP